MLIGTWLTLIMVCIISIYIFNILTLKDMRQIIKDRNLEMDSLMNKEDRSYEEQKRYIDLKFPRKQQWQFSWQWLVGFLKGIIFYMAFYLVWSWIFIVLNIQVSFVVSIILWAVVPLLFNLLLRKYSLHTQDDISIFFKGGKKK